MKLATSLILSQLDYWNRRSSEIQGTVLGKCLRFVGGTVKPRERWPDTGKRSRKGIRNAGQALFVGYMQL